MADFFSSSRFLFFFMYFEAKLPQKHPQNVVGGDRSTFVVGGLAGCVASPAHVYILSADVVLKAARTCARVCVNAVFAHLKLFTASPERACVCMCVCACVRCVCACRPVC